MKHLTVCLGLVIMLLISKSAYATPPTLPPDFNWFKVDTEVYTNNLPPGVTISKVSYNAQYPFSRFTIENTNATPLYFFLKKEQYIGYLQNVTFPKFKIPSDLIPLYTLASSKVHCQHYAWEGCNYYGGYYGYRYSSTDQHIFLDDALTFMDIRPIKNVYQENRPTNPLIPPPEDFKLLTYYDSKPVDIRGRFVYSLNYHYDTEMPNKNKDLKKISQKSEAKQYILIAGALLVVAYLASKTLITRG